MTKKEFLEGMDRIYFGVDEMYYCCCPGIGFHLNSDFADLFDELFWPRDKWICDKWFGDTGWFKTKRSPNQDVRLTALAIFEAIVLDEKLYKEW